MDGAALTVAGATTAGQGRTISLTANAINFGAGGSLTAPGGTVQLAASGTTPLTVGGTAGLTGTPPVAAQTLVLGTRAGGPVTLTGALNLPGVSLLDVGARPPSPRLPAASSVSGP